MAHSVADRFWEKVDKTEGCWVWLAGKAHGYGSVRIGGRSLGAHRFAYELLVGPIPEGLQLDHLCRNRACVNPAHLEPVTPAENKRRGESPPSLNAVKTRCVHGHELSGENLYVHPATGYRSCVQCRLEADRRHAAVRRERRRAA